MNSANHHLVLQRTLFAMRTPFASPVFLTAVLFAGGVLLSGCSSSNSAGGETSTEVVSSVTEMDVTESVDMGGAGNTSELSDDVVNDGANAN